MRTQSMGVYGEIGAAFPKRAYIGPSQTLLSLVQTMRAGLPREDCRQGLSLSLPRGAVLGWAAFEKVSGKTDVISLIACKTFLGQSSQSLIASVLGNRCLHLVATQIFNSPYSKNQEVQ